MKLEGGRKRLPMIEAIVDAEIPVMGHLGLTPQSVHAMGGFKVQGREHGAALELVADAKALAAAGCFAIVLEGVPDEVARMVTDAVDVPTIGIGAGGGTATGRCSCSTTCSASRTGSSRSSSAATRPQGRGRRRARARTPPTCGRVRSRPTTRGTTSRAEVAETLGLYGLAPIGVSPSRPPRAPVARCPA